MTIDCAPLIALVAHAGLALVFLLLGWRLGRESAGRPMFDHSLLPPMDTALPKEPDPWSEAVRGRESAAPGVDTFDSSGPLFPGCGPGINR